MKICVGILKKRHMRKNIEMIQLWRENEKKKKLDIESHNIS